MVKTLLCLAAYFSVFAQAWSVDAQVDTKVFMERLKGNYEVVAVNAAAPHSNNPAQISVEDPEGAEWSMPYCISDSCLPGFLTFTFNNTTVYEERASAAEVKFLIVFTENNVQKRFIWREVNGRIFFRNPQYDLPGQKTADIEHELKRTAD